jgi:hypothetical protein
MDGHAEGKGELNFLNTCANWSHGFKLTDHFYRSFNKESWDLMRIQGMKVDLCSTIEERNILVEQATALVIAIYMSS